MAYRITMSCLGTALNSRAYRTKAQHSIAWHSTAWQSIARHDIAQHGIAYTRGNSMIFPVAVHRITTTDRRDVPVPAKTRGTRNQYRLYIVTTKRSRNVTPTGRLLTKRRLKIENRDTCQIVPKWVTVAARNVRKSEIDACGRK